MGKLGDVEKLGDVSSSKRDVAEFGVRSIIFCEEDQKMELVVQLIVCKVKDIILLLIHKELKNRVNS